MPTQATSRRDPRNTGKGISKYHGFTVIELMISLGVLAVITSLALPSYRTILEKRQVTSGAEQLGAFLSSAQLESVKRNLTVAVSYCEEGDSDCEVDGPWCFGMRAEDGDGPGLDGVNVKCDCTVTNAAAGNACALDGDLKVFNASVLNNPDVLQSAVLGDGESFVYDPVRGLTTGPEGPTEVTLKLQSVPEGNYALDVEVTVTGRVKICSSEVDKNVPGYKECSA